MVNPRSSPAAQRAGQRGGKGGWVGARWMGGPWGTPQQHCQMPVLGSRRWGGTKAGRMAHPSPSPGWGPCLTQPAQCAPGGDCRAPPPCCSVLFCAVLFCSAHPAEDGRVGRALLHGRPDRIKVLRHSQLGLRGAKQGRAGQGEAGRGRAEQGTVGQGRAGWGRAGWSTVGQGGGGQGCDCQQGSTEAQADRCRSQAQGLAFASSKQHNTL